MCGSRLRQIPFAQINVISSGTSVVPQPPKHVYVVTGAIIGLNMAGMKSITGTIRLQRKLKTVAPNI